MKIATWNIGGGILGDSHQTDGFSQLEYHIDFIRRFDPDVICLQESHDYRSDKPSQTKAIAGALGYAYSSSTPISKSHLDPDAFLALGILSKYPILQTEYTKFFNPGLTATGPSGQRWELFDKGFCLHEIDVLGRTVSVVNAHCFPLHYFDATPSEPRFSEIWQSLSVGLEQARKNPLAVAAIDLNSPDIRNLLPGQLEDGAYVSAIDNVPTTPKGIQQDYLLYSNGFSLESTSVTPTRADHHFCLMELVSKEDDIR